MLSRANASRVSQTGLAAAADSVLSFPIGGVSFCSGVDRARGSYGEPKVTPPSLVYTPSDVTSCRFPFLIWDLSSEAESVLPRTAISPLSLTLGQTGGTPPGSTTCRQYSA